MDPTDPAPSQTSDGSSVVDLPCTYHLSQSVFLQEPPSASWEEEFCSTLTSASPLTSLKNAGSGKNSYDDSEELQVEDEKSQLVPQSSDALIVTQQSATTLNSFHKQEAMQGHSDVRIRASLDAFYKQSSWSGKNDTLCHQFAEKISKLSEKQHFYALRSFQLGKIVLNQEGEKILQNRSHNNLFSSRKETQDAIPVPGLSKDVISFIIDQKKSSPPHD
ncbi:shieldin complex subunit 1 [Dendropsophus ebraccatus]|uniref:shieldin complex subunit 1 n=1 Tax=Dendropsophus ebraccatus TaxID=150705 RepID=UPI003831AFA6